MAKERRSAESETVSEVLQKNGKTWLCILSPSPPKPHHLQDQCLEVGKLLHPTPREFDTDIKNNIFVQGWIATCERAEAAEGTGMGCDFFVLLTKHMGIMHGRSSTYGGSL